MICPIFNLFIDESWGLGSAEEWVQGCRANVQLTNRWMEMISGDWQQMDMGELAGQTCDMLLFQLNALLPGAGGAGEMCQCMMENILTVGFSGNVDMSMLGGALDCVNKTQQFITDIMSGHGGDHDDDHDDMDHHGSGDHDDEMEHGDDDMDHEEDDEADDDEAGDDDEEDNEVDRRR